jgi:DNA repair exonuclease SbcCD nuclease subunit
MKFIHCADLHLDSPLRGLTRYQGAPVDEMREATRRAFEQLIALALQEPVEFVVIAGDLFDGDWPDFNTGLFFVGQMVRLNEAGIKVFMVRGNHDAESRITRDLPLPSNVIVLPTTRPHTLIDEDLGVAVHGQSFPHGKVTDDLAFNYPLRCTGYFNLGILHTSLTGREGHANYAPCKVDTLLSKGYDYWALGHVHRREIVHCDPWIVFPGNTQGRMIRELGAKGCELVTVSDSRVSTEHRSLDVMRWESLAVDMAELDNLDDVFERVRRELGQLLDNAEGRTMVARVVVRGRGKVHAEITARPETVRAQIQALALDETNGQVWVEKVSLKTQAEIDLASLNRRDDPIGELVRLIHGIKAGSTEDLTNLATELSDLRRKLPVALTEGDEAIRLEDPEFLRQVLNEVERSLIPRLLGLAGNP